MASKDAKRPSFVLLLVLNLKIKTETKLFFSMYNQVAYMRIKINRG